MTGSPYFLDDADQVLADFGADLVCVAVPAVTKGLIDDAVVDQEAQGVTAQHQLTVLKVKRGAFGSTKVENTRVTITSRTPHEVYSIDGMVPRQSSLFDYYALQLVKQRSAS